MVTEISLDSEPLVFHDVAGSFEALQKTAEIGRYYFGWLSDWMRDILSTPFQWIGQYLRDRLYFPLIHPDEGYQWNMNMAKTLYEMLTGNETIPTTQAWPDVEAVRQAFTIKTVPIQVQSGAQTYSFQTYIVESKEKVDGKGLRLVLFSFYGNEKNGEPWKPQSIQELGYAPVLVLQGLQANGYQADSLDLFSLGAVTFQGLEYLKAEDAAIVPSTIILDRGMSSTYKLAQKLYGFFLRWPLYGAAYASNWDGDPEAACLRFFESLGKTEGRTVIQIEAVKDFYFSGPGGYASDFTQRLNDLGVTTYSGQFYVPCVPERSHHAFSRGLVYNNPGSGTSVENFIEMDPMESLSDALMSQLFLNPAFSSGEYHTSLVVGGNAEDLNIVLMRAFPSLASFAAKL